MFANAPDPATGTDVAILGADGVLVRVALPNEPWAEPWRGIHGIVPLDARRGFLLVGAARIFILDDQGAVSSTPVPDGYVALASTSDPQRFLLASEADADEPGALSPSTPFAVFIWTVGSPDPPSVVKQHITEVRRSSIGLAWLRADDGSWWSLANSGAIERHTDPAKSSSAISPDGTTLVVLSYTVGGCAQEASDSCQVRVVSQSGSQRPFDGPALGVEFDGRNVAIALAARPSLSLPLRVAYGMAESLGIATLE